MEKENGKIESNKTENNKNENHTEKTPAVIIPKSIYKLKHRTENGVKIFIVDGKKVRENYHIDFLAGGHYYRYNFIPEDEVWIDDAMNIDELEPIIVHELTERTLMKEQKMEYDPAHDIANKKELEVRTARNEIRDKINTILYIPTPAQTEPKLLVLVTTIKKVANLGFLKDRMEFEGMSFLKANTEDIMRMEISFKDAKDKSISQTLSQLFDKLNELEIKDKFFKLRIVPLDASL